MRISKPLPSYIDLSIRELLVKPLHQPVAAKLVD